MAAPTITEQPLSLNSLARPGKVTLSCRADAGADSLQFYWYKTDGANPTEQLNGAYTIGKLSVVTVDVTAFTYVRCRALNYQTGESTWSNTASILLPTSPPQRNVMSNATTYLSEAALPSIFYTAFVQGDYAINFQWFRRPTPISGEIPIVTPTSSGNPVPSGGGTYKNVMTSLQLLDAYFSDPTQEFFVRATAQVGDGSYQSADFTPITVEIKAPTITAQPSSLTINKPGAVTLTIAATGYGNHYQWRDSNGISVGTDSPSFTSPVLLSSTTYTCTVRNMAGTVTSNNATVTVNIPHPTITEQSASPIALTQPSAITLYVVPHPDSYITSYQWFEGLSGDTSRPIASATKNIYSTQTISSSTHFWCQIYGETQSNHFNSAVIAVNLAVAAPAITVEPESFVLLESGSVQLSVAATGYGLAFQWFEGFSGDTSTPVAGKNESTFITPTLSATTSYWCRISNAGGSANSETATVTLPGTLTYNARKLYMDISTGKLIAGLLDRQTLNSIEMKRGDTPVYHIYCTEDGVVRELPDGTTFKFGIKLKGDYSGDYLAYAEGVKSGSGEKAIYVFALNLSSLALSAALGTSAKLETVGEFEASSEDSISSSTSFAVWIHNDIIRGDETVAPLPGSRSGYSPFVAGQNYLDITFATPLPDAGYRYAERTVQFVGTGDIELIQPSVVSNKTAFGFRQYFTAAPAAAVDYLYHWRTL